MSKSRAALFIYRMPADDNVLETCIKSLRRHNTTVRIVLITDGITPVLDSRLKKLYGVEIVIVKSMKGERMRRKLIEVNKWAVNNRREIDEIAYFDADLYFDGDPFEAFDEYKFDVGITLKPYWNPFQVNLGVLYYRMDRRGTEMKRFLRWASQAVQPPEWEPLKKFMQEYGHQSWHGDWWIDQDLFCVLWKQREKIICQEYGLDMVNVGHKYNFCTKRLSEKGRASLIENYRAGNATTYHLRGRLKDLIYEGIFPDVVLCHQRMSHNWGSHGGQSPILGR